MSEKRQEYSYYRKPAPIVFVMLGLVVCVIAAVVLTRQQEHSLKLRMAMTGYIWMGLLLLRLFLVSSYRIRITSAGIEFTAILRTVRVAWDQVCDVRWQPIRNSQQPNAKSILVTASGSTREIPDAAYCAGDRPILESLLLWWPGPAPGEVAEPRSPLHRYAGWCAIYTVATTMILLALSRSGWVAPPFEPLEAVAYSAGMFALVGIIFLLPSASRMNSKLEEYRPVEAYAVREIPVVDPTLSTHEIGFWLFRKLFPTPQDARPVPEQMRELEHQMSLRSSKINKLQFLLLVPILLLGTCLPYHVNQTVQHPLHDPVFSNTQAAAIIWFVCSFMVGLVIVIFVSNAYDGYRDPDGYALHRRFENTLRGYDTVKAARLTCVMGLVMGAFAAVYAWNFGDVIDASGIRFKPGPVTTYQRQYSDVRRITISRRLRAPVGVLSHPNVRVDFVSGPPFELIEDKDSALREDWRRAAEYISEQSGVPITYADIRPDPAL